MVFLTATLPKHTVDEYAESDETEAICQLVGATLAVCGARQDHRVRGND